MGGQKIFLTGASSGIGLATAKALLARGHQVWGTARDAGRVPSLNDLHAITLDLSDPGSIRDGFEEGLRQAGSFDVMINNAGSGHFGAAESLSIDEIRSQFQTLVFGHIDLCFRGLAAMRQQERGLIINVTSLAAELPVPYMAAYNAAKAAMASFTMSMQFELSGSNIRLLDLQPADINTGFNDAVLRNGPADPRIERVWRVVDRNMKKAPKPELVGKWLAELIERTDPRPRVIVGDFFQSKVAPLLNQLLPQRVRVWGLKKYYGI
ncbi:MAG: SDR family NAD(P)-dependent oxidoreductase [Verrucomicrobiota bacterium]|nr:SDR family NAD(P)-dependent oxidoreductase [Verrucomicrobiota bacterium]